VHKWGRFTPGLKTVEFTTEKGKSRKTTVAMAKRAREAVEEISENEPERVLLPKRTKKPRRHAAATTKSAQPSKRRKKAAPRSAEELHAAGQAVEATWRYATGTRAGYDGHIRRLRQFASQFPEYHDVLDTPSEATAKLFYAYLAHKTDPVNGEGCGYKTAEGARSAMLEYCERTHRCQVCYFLLGSRCGRRLSLVCAGRVLAARCHKRSLDRQSRLFSRSRPALEVAQEPARPYFAAEPGASPAEHFWPAQ
jgi:hypothetical protein